MTFFSNTNILGMYTELLKKKLLNPCHYLYTTTVHIYSITRRWVDKKLFHSVSKTVNFFFAMPQNIALLVSLFLVPPVKVRSHHIVAPGFTMASFLPFFLICQFGALPNFLHVLRKSY